MVEENLQLNPQHRLDHRHLDPSGFVGFVRGFGRNGRHAPLQAPDQSAAIHRRNGGMIGGEGYRLVTGILRFNPPAQLGRFPHLHGNALRIIKDDGGYPLNHPDLRAGRQGRIGKAGRRNRAGARPASDHFARLHGGNLRIGAFPMNAFVTRVRGRENGFQINRFPVRNCLNLRMVQRNRLRGPGYRNGDGRCGAGTVRRLCRNHRVSLFQPGDHPVLIHRSDRRIPGRPDDRLKRSV